MTTMQQTVDFATVRPVQENPNAQLMPAIVGVSIALVSALVSILITGLPH